MAFSFLLRLLVIVITIRLASGNELSNGTFSKVEASKKNADLNASGLKTKDLVVIDALATDSMVAYLHQKAANSHMPLMLGGAVLVTLALLAVLKFKGNRKAAEALKETIEAGVQKTQQEGSRRTVPWPAAGKAGILPALLGRCPSAWWRLRGRFWRWR